MYACCDHALLGNGNFYQHVVEFILNSQFLSLSPIAVSLLKSCEFVLGLSWGAALGQDLPYTSHRFVFCPILSSLFKFLYSIF